MGAGGCGLGASSPEPSLGPAAGVGAGAEWDAVLVQLGLMQCPRVLLGPGIVLPRSGMGGEESWCEGEPMSECVGRLRPPHRASEGETGARGRAGEHQDRSKSDLAWPNGLAQAAKCTELVLSRRDVGSE